MQFTQNLVCLQQKGSDVSRTIFDQVSLVDLGDFFFIFRSFFWSFSELFFNGSRKNSRTSKANQ